MDSNYNNVQAENEIQKVHKYLDCDFYKVELDDDCNKIIHPVGFIYDTEYSMYEDEPNRTYCFHMYWGDFVIQVDELNDKWFDYFLTCQENIDFDCAEDISKEKAYELLNNGLGFIHEKIVELSIDKVNKHTPCGWYVNYPNPYLY